MVSVASPASMSHGVKVFLFICFVLAIIVFRNVTQGAQYVVTTSKATSTAHNAISTAVLESSTAPTARVVGSTSDSSLLSTIVEVSPSSWHPYSSSSPSKEKETMLIRPSKVEESPVDDLARGAVVVPLSQQLEEVERRVGLALSSRFQFQDSLPPITHRGKRPHHVDYDEMKRQWPVPVEQSCSNPNRPDQFCTPNLGRDWVNGSRTVFPISYSLPEELYESKVPSSSMKDQDSSIIIPRVRAGYKFTKQAEYRDEYRRSYYCLTFKKGGWDALRHYEIIAAGCMPYIPDIDYAPIYTMYHFPKHLVLQARELRGVTFNCSSLRVNIDHQVFPVEEYFRLLHLVMEHAKRHLTTKAMAQYVLDASGNSNARRVLYFARAPKGVQARAMGNYNTWTLFHGFRSLLGGGGGEQEGKKKKRTPENVVDFEVLPFMYNQSDALKSSLRPRLYGQGFGYAFMLPHEDGGVHSKVDRSEIVQRIKNKEFDVIIYADPTLMLDKSRRSFLFYDDHVKKYYAKEQIIFLHAPDIPYPGQGTIGYHVAMLYSMGTVFQREIMDCTYYSPPPSFPPHQEGRQGRKMSLSASQAMKRCIWYVNKNCFDDVNFNEAMKTKRYASQHQWSLLS